MAASIAFIFTPYGHILVVIHFHSCSATSPSLIKKKKFNIAKSLHICIATKASCKNKKFKLEIIQLK